MKKRITVVAILFVVSCLVLFSSPVIAKEFVLGTIANTDTPLVKVRVAFLEEVFKTHGYDLTVKTMPALRSLEAANTGQTDGDFLRQSEIDQAKYPNLVRVDCPTSYYPLYAFSNNPTIQIDGLKSLSSHQVILLRGETIMEKVIMPLIPKDKITMVASYEQAFKMLAAGRADVVVSDKSRAFYHMKNLGIEDKITMVKKPLLLVNLYTWLNKKHAALADKIAATMKARMDDGTYEKVVGVPAPKPDK